MAFPLGWPPALPSGTRSLRFFATGTATANFSDNAFLFAGANKSYAVIGGLDINGLVFVSSTATGQATNEYSIEVRIPTTGHPAALAASFDSVYAKHVIVSLATTAGGVADAAANTATLVAAAVNALVGVDAFAGGTGATALIRAEPARYFVGGGSGLSPSPSNPPGQVIGTPVPTSYGSSLAGSPPFGNSGNIYYAPTDSYYPPPVTAVSQSIRVDNGVGGTLEISFDGINIHGSAPASSSLEFYTRHEAGIAVRGAGATFRIHAW